MELVFHIVYELPLVCLEVLHLPIVPIRELLLHLTCASLVKDVFVELVRQQ